MNYHYTTAVMDTHSGTTNAVDDRLISSDVLSGCDELAQQTGINIAFYLSRAGIDRGALSSAGGLLPFRAVSDFLEDVAETENIPDLGFRLGLIQKPLQYGIISQLPAISPDIGSAFANFIKYQKLYSQSSHWELIVDDGFVFMRRHDVAQSARANPQLVLLSVTLAVTAVKAITGQQWRPTGIYFDMDSFAAIDAMRRHFNCPVFCGMLHNQIAFSEDDLSKPIATSNPALLFVLTQHFDQLLQAVPNPNDLTSLVFHNIRSNLGDHRCTLDWTARALHMHPRTMQRLLIDEGTSFRELSQKARVELADYLLRLTRTPISDISSLLGYSNVSGFSRAFERIRGHSPTQERLSARKMRP